MEQEVEVLSMDESYHRIGEVRPKGLSKPYLVPVVFDKNEVQDVPMQTEERGEHSLYQNDTQSDSFWLTAAESCTVLRRFGCIIGDSEQLELEEALKVAFWRLFAPVYIYICVFPPPPPLSLSLSLSTHLPLFLLPRPWA